MGQVPVFQHRHQAAGHDVVVDDVAGLDEDAHAVQRGGAHDLAVVGLQQALDLDGLVLARAHLGEAQLVRRVGVQVDQQLVLLQVVQALGEAVLRQVTR